MNQMNTGNRKEEQLAVACYLIDKLALRVGNEKGEDEADTVGCCSFRCEHVEVSEEEGKSSGKFVSVDFLGMDSMRYQKTVEVHEIVYDAMKRFK